MLLLVVYAVSPQFQHRTDLALKEAHTSSKSAVTSIGARIETWRFMTSSSTKMTLLGAGTASYPVFAKTYFKDPEFCAVVCPHPHNQFLLFYFELGLVGLALFFWFIGTLVRRAFAVTLVHRGLLLGFVAIMLVSNMTHSSLWLSTESHFFIMMTALLMASATPARRTIRRLRVRLRRPGRSRPADAAQSLSCQWKLGQPAAVLCEATAAGAGG